MTEFFGQPAASLVNSYVRLDYLTQAGPRIVGLYLAQREENLLVELPEEGWETPGGYFQFFGGHRLWAAPEVAGVSYLPDSDGLRVEQDDSSATLTWEPRSGRGLSKTVRIKLIDDRAAVHVTHHITNRYDHPVRVAPWGITALPLGGKAYLPAAAQGEGFLPDRQLIVWPYARWDDPRLHLMRGGVAIDGDAALPPVKVGTYAHSGCCAYLREELLLVKRFQPTPGEYPDRGCNVEVYCSDLFIELETLGPLADLPPGAEACAEETWELYAGQQALQMLDQIFDNGGHA